MSEVAEIVAAVSAVLDERFARFQDGMERAIDKGIAHLERDVKEDTARHSAEFLRVWEEIDKLKTWKNQQVGGHARLGSVTHFFSAIFGGLITALVTWLSSGKPPH